MVNPCSDELILPIEINVDELCHEICTKSAMQNLICHRGLYSLFGFPQSNTYPNFITIYKVILCVPINVVSDNQHSMLFKNN